MRRKTTVGEVDAEVLAYTAGQDRVLDLALERKPEPLPDDATPAAAVPAVGEEGDAGSATRRAH